MKDGLNNESISELYSVVNSKVNFILGPPSVGKTTSCQLLVKNFPVTHLSFDIIDEQTFGKFSKQSRDDIIRIFRAILCFMVKDKNPVQFIVDIHPWLLEALLDYIIPTRAFIGIINIDHDFINHKAAIERYKARGGGSIDRAKYRYNQYFYDLYDYLLKDISPKMTVRLYSTLRYSCLTFR